MAKKPTGKNTSGRGQRDLTIKVKSARGRKLSSTRWLQRQLNDPYVARAKAEGYRGRAAFKIMELDDKFRFLVPGARVVDLGCAPGGWLQVVSIRTKLGSGPARLVGIDLLETEGVVGADIFTGDMTDPAMLTAVEAAIGGAADGVMSDMAADTTGHRPTDHLRTTALLEAALDFALGILNEDGFFLAKCFRGGAEKSVLDVMQQNFSTVRHVKPAASRAESVESYVLASGFHGRNRTMMQATNDDTAASDG